MGQPHGAATRNRHLVQLFPALLARFRPRLAIAEAEDCADRFLDFLVGQLSSNTHSLRQLGNGSEHCVTLGLGDSFPRRALTEHNFGLQRLQS